VPALAKLTRPRSHRVLRRETVFERVDAAREHPLVWVQGAPGAGKSTLVASYIETRKLPCVWFHVDAGDDDPGTFFYYLAQSQPPRKAKPPLPLLTPEYRGDLQGFSRHFFRQFFSQVAADTMLVFDNYHELSAASEVHIALERAVAEVPHGCNTIVISRAAPPAQLAHYRMSQKLATIEDATLRLSLEETRALAGLRYDLDEPTLRRIYELADGWAAGIALTLQRAEQLRGASTDAQHGELEGFFDYFAAQVLQTVRPELRDFLRVTSLLPTMTAQMAQRLTGREDADTLLEGLYRAGTFTNRRSTEPPTYQYHDLFRAFLSRELESRTETAALAIARRTAGALLEESKHYDAAIRLYLSAQDWPAATRLILATARPLMAQGRNASVLEWIRSLPDDIAAHNPWLQLSGAAAQIPTTPTLARRAFATAHEIFRTERNTDGETLACAGMLLAYMYEFADFTGVDRWLDALVDLLGSEPRFPSPAVELQVQRALLFGLSFCRPRRPAIERCIERLFALMALDVPNEDAAMAGGVMVIHAHRVGDVDMLNRAASRLTAMVERQPMSPLTRALSALQIGRFHYVAGRHAEAIRELELALDIVARNAISLPVVNVQTRLALAFSALEIGDLKAAEAYGEAIQAFWNPARRMDEFASLRLKLWLACRRGQWDAGLEFARRQLQVGLTTGVFWAAFEGHLQLAILLAETGRSTEFAAALAPAGQMLEGTGYEYFQYQIELTEAYEALLRGDRARCHDKLRSGLALSREDGTKFILRMQPNMLPRLLAEALAADIEVEYAERTIRSLGLRPPSLEVRNWPWPLRIRTLGKFEVLRDGAPLEFSRKAPKKALALLKALVAFGGTNVAEQRLLDAFWPDEEGDAAARSLTATLHRLRNLIGDAEAIVQQGGTLSLDPARVWVDVRAFESLLAGSAEVHASELLALYRGSFLSEDESEQWSVLTRERLRGKFIHAVAQEAQRLEKAGRFDAALALYLKGIDADPVIELFYQGLMRCYAQLGRRTEAASAYQRLKRLLSMTLGLAPSTTTERLYQSLRQ
jgi:LuxR family transcriptional regulator, maltose regulon positive regulatory protein